MKRGEVWWVNFEPSVGGEIRKKRPAVIISNDAANKYLNRVQVVPLTSKVEHIYPSEALVGVDDQQNKAMADQLTTVSKQRLIDRMSQRTVSTLISPARSLRLRTIDYQARNSYTGQRIVEQQDQILMRVAALSYPCTASYRT
jgi:mRNA interferase MazF